MLDPQDRQLLFDALRPDPGMVLDRAVGTSFSLDLEALLLAPLAFALFETDGAATDPTALLAAIQQHAANLALYCDEAHIRSAVNEQKLFVLLEPSLLPVAAPRGGSFHPKVWVLRFRDADHVVLHRVLVLSRNLTFDTSWDLVARLDESSDGVLAGDDVAQVLRGLDRLATSPITSSIARSVASVRFSVPDPFEDGRLHAIGFSQGAPQRDPITRDPGERALVMSPFLTSGRLDQLRSLGSRSRTLVSRAEELERLGGGAVGPWGVPMILKDAAGAANLSANAAFSSLRGLHAKLHVTDRGERSVWFLGSANATTSAVDRNVETVLELAGPTRKVGVGKLLSDAGTEVRFRALLEDFPLTDPNPLEPTPEDVEQERLEDLTGAICSVPLEIRVSERDVGYELDLLFDLETPDLEKGDQLRARPVTRSTWTDASLDRAPAATLRVARVSEIISLIAFELSGSEGLVPPRAFVVAGRLVDAPSNRLDQVLVDLIPDRRRFALLLFLMLAASDPDAVTTAVARQLSATAPDTPGDDSALGIPLYEALVRASARDLGRLEAIDRLVDRLTQTEAGRERLPDDFAEMWQAFRPLLARGTP